MWPKPEKPQNSPFLFLLRPTYHSGITNKWMLSCDLRRICVSLFRSTARESPGLVLSLAQQVTSCAFCAVVCVCKHVWKAWVTAVAAPVPSAHFASTAWVQLLTSWCSRVHTSGILHIFPPNKLDPVPQFSNSRPSGEESGPQDEGGDDVRSSLAREGGWPEQLRQVFHVQRCWVEP